MKCMPYCTPLISVPRTWNMAKFTAVHNIRFACHYESSREKWKRTYMYSKFSAFFVGRILRLGRNMYWHLYASFDSLLSPLNGLRHLGKGWIVRVPYWANGSSTRAGTDCNDFILWIKGRLHHTTARKSRKKYSHTTCVPCHSRVIFARFYTMRRLLNAIDTLLVLCVMPLFRSSVSFTIVHTVLCFFMSRSKFSLSCDTSGLEVVLG